MRNGYERETIINMCDAEDTAIIETYQRYWMNRILKAKEKATQNGNPNDVIIVKQTEEMIEAIVPKRYVRISAPRFVSEEQRQSLSDRAKKMQNMRIKNKRTK